MMESMMKTEIFNNREFGSIRIINENGTLLFCGADVASALGYINSRKALIDHCKGVTKRDTLTAGGVQSLSYITEGDVYRLIAHSRLPSAERFEKWVFDEVLPTIRQTGGYMTDGLLEQAAKDPAVLLQFAAELLKKHEENEHLTRKVRNLEPKAAYYDAFIHPGECTNIRATAKELSVGERAFCRFLMEAGFLYRCPGGYLLPYAKPSNAELFRVKDYVAENGHVGQQTVITPQGKALFRMLLCGENN